MFVFGHLGIGKLLAKPWRKGLPLAPLLLGTLLPDLIDKPLYYFPSWITGKRGIELGLISGTRSFGHTALFALALLTITFIRRSRTWAAITLGVATHLLLDGIGDQIGGRPDMSPLLWPFTGWAFPIYPHSGFTQHLGTVFAPYIFFGEILGAALLLQEFWSHRKFRKTLKPNRKNYETLL